jgi:hypothetical protein
VGRPPPAEATTTPKLTAEPSTPESTTSAVHLFKRRRFHHLKYRRIETSDTCETKKLSAFFCGFFCFFQKIFSIADIVSFSISFFNT